MQIFLYASTVQGKLQDERVENIALKHNCFVHEQVQVFTFIIHCYFKVIETYSAADVVKIK